MPTKDEMIAAEAYSPINEEDKKSNKSKLYNITKIVILGIAVLVLFIGILGSMHWGIFSSFVMDDFVSFIGEYNSIFITLIASIGAGGGIKNIVEALKNRNKKTSGDDGEDIARGGSN